MKLGGYGVLVSTAGGLRAQMHTSLINELAAAGGVAWGPSRSFGFILYMI